MVDILARQIENLETIQVNGNIHEIYGIKGCKSFKSYIQSRINHFLKTGDKLEEMKLRTILGVYEKFHGEEIKDLENLKLEIEIIGKVKGIGTVEIYRGFDNNINIKIPIKDKDTGIVKWIVRELKKEDLNRMIHIVRNLPLNETVSCYEIAEKLGYDWKEVWKMRTKIYFPIYYFPLKFLEASKMIKYSGRGEVTRII
jgi:hypothetical protein